MASPSPAAVFDGVSHLSAAEAAAVDAELMGPLGYSVEQLMELAGLSCALAVLDAYPPASHPRALVLAGPGNNGGDGLVAARHLSHFGYRVAVCLPGTPARDLYARLAKQCEGLGIPFVGADEAAASPLAERCDVVLDALFGFSYRGEPRAPYDRVLSSLLPGASPPPIVSVDVPSGWPVDGPPAAGDPGKVQPDALVSLTAPKLCARGFAGRHYLGGRFVPPAISGKYGLALPAYPAGHQVVRVGAPHVDGSSVADMRITYDRGDLLEGACPADPLALFAEWLQAAVESGVVEANAMTVASVSPDGRPSSRVVLLKGFDQRGFVFYTNYASRKGAELDATGHAALSFWW